jgi:predicted  nucleic acid-binding Zn-ribbon protein
VETKDIEKDIKKLKNEIDIAKQEKAEAEGSLKTLLSRLKNEFNLTNIEKARAKVIALQEEKVTIESELDESFEELSDNYEW